PRAERSDPGYSPTSRSPTQTQRALELHLSSLAAVAAPRASNKHQTERGTREARLRYIVTYARLNGEGDRAWNSGSGPRAWRLSAWIAWSSACSRRQSSAARRAAWMRPARAG